MSMRETLDKNNVVETKESKGKTSEIRGFDSEVESVSENPILKMQQSIGNRNTMKALNDLPGAAIQTKLTVGQVGDKYEQEADKMADRIVEEMHGGASASVGEISNDMSGGNTIQRKEDGTGGGTDTASVEGSMSKSSASSGHGDLLDRMGKAFKTDFSDVNIHTDASSESMNESLSARAFTKGKDIFFNKGEYNPGSKEGQKLLAHELTHVVQQRDMSSASGDMVQCKPNFSKLTAAAKAKKAAIAKSMPTAEGVQEGFQTGKDAIQDPLNTMFGTTGSILGGIGDAVSTQATQFDFATSGLDAIGNGIGLGIGAKKIHEKRMAKNEAASIKDPLKAKFSAAGESFMTKGKHGKFSTDGAKLDSEIQALIDKGSLTPDEQQRLDDMKAYRQARIDKASARDGEVEGGVDLGKNALGLVGDMGNYAKDGVSLAGDAFQGVATGLGYGFGAVGIATGAISTGQDIYQAYKAEKTKRSMMKRMEGSEFAVKEPKLDKKTGVKTMVPTGKFNEWDAEERLRNPATTAEEKEKIEKERLAYHLKGQNKRRRNTAITNAVGDGVGVVGSIAGTAGSGVGGAVGGALALAIKGGQTLAHKGWDAARGRVQKNDIGRFNGDSYAKDANTGELTPESRKLKNSDYNKYLKSSEGLAKTREHDAEVLLGMRSKLKAGNFKDMQDQTEKEEEFGDFLGANGADAGDLDKLDSIQDPKEREAAQKEALIKAQSRRGDMGEAAIELAGTAVSAGKKWYGKKKAQRAATPAKKTP